MSVLSPASKKALANLRAFAAPPTNYYKCPVNRRAAVLILLFADRKGDLRVVLTIRSSGLKNYAGQAALPGGKADSLEETPWITARREAYEEIGLPMKDSGLPTGYTVEHLTELPVNLALTELGVRPCVAYLRTPDPSPANKRPDVARDILPKLDAREVAAVFTAPFRNFLHARDLDPDVRKRVPGEWYKGSWHSWHESAWRMHQFNVPVTPSTVYLARVPRSFLAPRTPAEVRTAAHASASAAVQKVEAGKKEAGVAGGENKEVHGEGDGAGAGAMTAQLMRERQKKPADNTKDGGRGGLQPPLPKTFYTNGDDALQQPRYRVFGMTARILVDAARVAYGEEPEYEHNSHFGDEEMLAKLIKIGRLNAVKKEGQVLTREVMMEAARAKI